MLKKFFKYGGVIIFFVIIGSVAGVLTDIFLIPYLSSFESLQANKYIKKVNEKVTIINKTEQITIREDFSVTKVAENILPAVVSVVSYQETEEKAAVSNIKSSNDIEESIVTGTIITSDGLVVSVSKKSHEEMKEMKHKVLISDGKEFDADLIGVDSYSNLSFFQISQSNFAVPRFGNSEELKNGEKIILCGNSGGDYQNTFSLGIIREKNRTFSLLNSELSSSEKMEGAIIVDATIDQKNIGGPAVDFAGTMVGVTGFTQKDGEEVGYVIPMSLVVETIDRVIKTGGIERPTLGLYYLSIDREISLLNNLEVTEGALIHSFSEQQGLAVLKGSPADLAGIRLGDVVIAVDDQKIDLKNPLSRLISQKKKGDKISLKILRNKEIVSMEVIMK